MKNLLNLNDSIALSYARISSFNDQLDIHLCPNEYEQFRTGWKIIVAAVEALWKANKEDQILLRMSDIAALGEDWNIGDDEGEDEKSEDEEDHPAASVDTPRRTRRKTAKEDVRSDKGKTKDSSGGGNKRRSRTGDKAFDATKHNRWHVQVSSLLLVHFFL